MKTKLKGKFSLLFLALAALLAIPAVALADNLKNDVQNTTGVGQQRDYTAGATATSVGYYIDANNSEGFKNCDATTGSPATVSLSVSSFPAGSSADAVNISPKSQQFKQCEVKQQFDFSTAADAQPGKYEISAKVSDDLGDYNPSPATFVLNVQAPPATTPTTPTNAAPIVGDITGDSTADEGQTKSYSVSATDADNDTLTYFWQVTSGAAEIDGSNAGSSADVKFLDGPDNVTLNVEVSDGTNAAVKKSTQVEVSNVAPTLSNLVLTGNSVTACLTGNEVSISYDVSDPGLDDFTPSVTWGDGTTDDTFKHTYAAGKYTIAVDGKDSDEAPANTLNSANNAVSLLYNVSNGLLSPVNANGSSIFKYGSTIPMKVMITDCNNSPVTNLTPAIKFQKMSGGTPVQNINESVSTSAADTNNFMRYSGDALSGQYIYNLNTKNTYDVPDPQATYRAVISDSSIDSMNSQNFGIKK